MKTKSLSYMTTCRSLVRGMFDCEHLSPASNSYATCGRIAIALLAFGSTHKNALRLCATKAD
ncbi:hypothetical protein AWB67_02681 [Caballeronia terrestris]|uniref:Uncharacterized protein n=1 Tax=Caballeronia terrestris TaxID=1226301 RepID=A0A158IMI0_9BURK|nr:hypothetical protein AWB67_02681 [Caballeronia terrestris]